MVVRVHQVLQELQVALALQVMEPQVHQAHQAKTVQAVPQELQAKTVQAVLQVQAVKMVPLVHLVLVG